MARAVFFQRVKSPRKCRLCHRVSDGRRVHRNSCAYRTDPGAANRKNPERLRN